MSDAIGNMSKVVEFLQNSPVQVGAGNRDAYTVALTTRGSLRQDSGERQQNYGDISGYQYFLLKLRKRDDLQTLLQQSLKIRISGRVYTVQSWDDTDKMYITFNLATKYG